MSKTKKTSVGRRGFLQGAAAIVATAQSVSNNAVAQNSQNSLGPAAGQEWLALTQEAPSWPTVADSTVRPSSMMVSMQSTAVVGK